MCFLFLSTTVFFFSWQSWDSWTPTGSRCWPHERPRRKETSPIQTTKKNFVPTRRQTSRRLCAKLPLPMWPKVNTLRYLGCSDAAMFHPRIMTTDKVWKIAFLIWNLSNDAIKSGQLGVFTQDNDWSKLPSRQWKPWLVFSLLWQ